MRCYEAFGLKIESDWELPELREASFASADVEFRRGGVSDFADLGDARLLVQPGRFVAKLEGVGRFCVRDGREVLVELDERAAEADARLYLLGLCMGALLTQRGVLVLHGSAVKLNGKAVAFLGASGLGKSTLANAFRLLKGCQFITDDLCVVAFPQCGKPHLLPGYGQTKLWPDAMASLGIESEGTRLLGTGLEKRGVALDVVSREVEIAGIFILEVEGARELRVEKLRGSNAVMGLVKETYRSGFLEVSGLQAEHFLQASKLAGDVPIWKLSRRRSELGIERMAEAVEEALAGGGQQSGRGVGGEIGIAEELTVRKDAELYE